MDIVTFKFRPPVGRAWLTIHWSLGWTPDRIEAEMRRRGLAASVIYRDAGGTYWIPLHDGADGRESSGGKDMAARR